MMHWIRKTVWPHSEPGGYIKYSSRWVKFKASIYLVLLYRFGMSLFPWYLFAVDVVPRIQIKEEDERPPHAVRRGWRRAWNGMNEVNPCYVELSGLALAITEITITTSLLHPSESTCVCTCVSDICKEPSKNLTSKKGFLYINRFCRIAKKFGCWKRLKNWRAIGQGEGKRIRG